MLRESLFLPLGSGLACLGTLLLAAALLAGRRR